MTKMNRLKIVLEKDKTRKLLADQLGKSICTASKWCNKAIHLNLQTLRKIAYLLNVDARSLLSPTNLQS